MMRAYQAGVCAGLIVLGLGLGMAGVGLPAARANDYLSANRWQAMTLEEKQAQLRQLAQVAEPEEAGPWRLRPSVRGMDYRDLYQVRLPSHTQGAPSTGAVRRVERPPVRLPWER